MPQVVIENPILNPPFAEPTRHFQFSDDGITDEIVHARRVSSYFIPIARPKKKGKQLVFDTEWTQDRIEENRLVNQIRQRVAAWREGGYVGLTPTTARLLQYWTDPQREKKLFFCQIEALETAIYITEVARRHGDAWIENHLRDANEGANPGLPRIAFKMATGSGKTVVMAMLIAWHALNKLANPQDARFSDTFLIVTPGITIRDRLRVLLPNDPGNYYRQRDILPMDDLARLGQARIVITNFHALQLREKVTAGKLTKAILAEGRSAAFTETPDQMVRRVCRELGNKKNIIVINDEAHHCYRRKPDGQDEPLTGQERKEAEKRDKEARVWISGIEAVKSKIGAKTVYDLSATPFFLRGSGYPEGTLFPWVVSDFSLIDAIEAGIVKVPRVPVADDSVTGEQPTYRDLWLRIREHLPKKGRKTDAVTGEPKLPAELQGALHSLYGNYEKYYTLWRDNTEATARGVTPPVFIVVCNNTNVSKLVFDYVAGWERQVGDRPVVQAGALPIFRNDDASGDWLHRPNTILVDSEQLESGEAMSKEFKKIAAREIEEFKAEYRTRFPGRDAEALTDEDLLREVMNTVGKPGKLGEHVKCVVSVSMLTEGWDANTVTHVLGVRAFGTQLLCEQVVGRGLRRMSYAPNEAGRFEPEYAEVYGVPFSFIPCSGSTADPKPGPMPTRVRALEPRSACQISFPRLQGYRYDLPGERLTARFTDDSKLALSTADVPTKTENAPIVGQTSIHTLDDLKRRRPNEVAFLLAKLTLERYFRDEDGNDRPWLFPQLLRIAKRWLTECLVCKDNTFPQLLLLIQFAHDAADRIYKAIVQATEGRPALKPILRPYDTLGSTRYVDFDTTRPVYSTRPDKCHVSHVVADTDSWEQKMAQTLEDMPEVVRYVKNHNLGFAVPYTLNGQEKAYYPDFIAVIRAEPPASARPDAAAPSGPPDELNLIIEVTGEKKKDKAAKVSTARTLWVPAVNNHGGLGPWAFLEITDPWDAMNAIRSFLAGGRSQ
ncbi:MAG: DEAD/DEAH box helicase family protein [Phycisphaerae bacterium]|nr:DEAD/DEAH box helicase family protein [Phycisphaerae bacterium]